MVKEITSMMSALKAKGVKVCGTASEFYSAKTHIDGIWVAAEYTPDLFDYWSEAWADTFGVKPSLNKLVEESGWYFEWHDAGTMMVWKQ